MKQRSKLFCLVLLLSLISSCVSYERITIEVFKPAKYSLPPDVHKIALISRNLKYTKDTLQNYQNKNHRLIKDRIWANSDSMAIPICMDSLAFQLRSQNRIDSVILLPINTYQRVRANEIRPANMEWYKKVSRATRADGLVLLDMFSCFYSQETNYSAPTAKVVTSNIWSFYDANQQKITDRFIQIDTLYWNRTDEDGNVINKNIPDKKEAIGLAAGVIGKNYSKHITPSWNMVFRNMMISKEAEAKKAFNLAKNGEWDKASAIWQKYTESKNKKLKIIGLYNLALAHEMNGEIEQAIELTDLAAQISSGLFLSSENEAIRKYSIVLYQRKNEIQKLNLQYEAH